MTSSATIDTALGGRPYLFALAVLNGIMGLAALVILAPLTFGGDVDIFRRGAEGVANGVIAQDFLYAPLAGVLALPLTWLPFPAAAAVMSGLGLVLLLGGIVIETRRLDVIDRVLVGIAALGFIPVVYELVVGQVTMLLAASVFLVRDRDGVARGIPLGIMLALTPKPVLALVLLWMLVRRRRALAGTIASGLVVTVLGIALLGIDLYRAWIDALIATGQITRSGNLSLTVLGSPPLVLVLSALAIAGAIWAIVADERRGFTASILAALLVAPFTLMYQVSIVLVVVRPALVVSPRVTRVAALVANPAVLVAFVPWTAASLAAILPWRATHADGPAEP
jgi:hypothetical protein